MHMFISAWLCRSYLYFMMANAFRLNGSSIGFNRRNEPSILPASDKSRYNGSLENRPYLVSSLSDFPIGLRKRVSDNVSRYSNNPILRLDTSFLSQTQLAKG